MSITDLHFPNAVLDYTDGKKDVSSAQINNSTFEEHKMPSIRLVVEIPPSWTADEAAQYCLDAIQSFGSKMSPKDHRHFGAVITAMASSTHTYNVGHPGTTLTKTKKPRPIIKSRLKSLVSP